MTPAPAIPATVPGTHFRTMARADLDEVMAIENVSFPSPWTEAMILRELETEPSLHRVAEREGQVAGYMISWLTPPEAMILSLAVHPDLRRQGIARGLMQDSFPIFTRTGIEVVWLEVRTGNLKAQGLYLSFGFREAYRRPAYYHDTGEDAIVMMKRISP